MTPAAQITEMAKVLRRAVLGARQTEMALGVGRVLGRLLWDNPIGPMADEPLEAALLTSHGPTLTKEAEALRVDTPLTDWLHVISEAYDLGGHTRLLESLLAAQASRQSAAVAVTTSHTARFAAHCADLGVPIHRLGGSLTKRSAGLISLGRRAQQVMLHIHPDDLGAALAARVLRNEGRRVAFLNHADHVFSFGPGAADVVVEVSGFGWRLTSERRAARAQYFLGIPVAPSTPLIQSDSARAIAEGPILSIGNAHKYRPDGAQNFADFLMTLMDRIDRPVELIGPRPEDSWWQPVLARHGDRLRLCGPLPFEETRARLAAAACYVDSFPVTGGTALTQALIAGKTVFAPPNPAGGYSLADALRAPSVATMTEQILSFLSTGAEPAEQKVIRTRIAAEFGSEALVRRLVRLENGAHDPPPAEMLAAAQDLDYYIDAWRRSGRPKLTFPRRVRPTVAIRLGLSVRLLGNSGIDWSKLHTLLRWTLLGS